MRIRLRFEKDDPPDSLLRSVRVETSWHEGWAYTGHLIVTPEWLANLGDPEPMETVVCELSLERVSDE